MKLVVISCWAYRDAWRPFFSLLDKFWPDHPTPVWLLTDRMAGDGPVGKTVAVYSGPHSQRWPWCQVLLNFLRAHDSTPVLLMQEDFFLNAPVYEPFIEHGLKLLKDRNAGCVRLYPSPGGIEYCGDDLFALVPPGAPNRISCQAALWDPNYLAQVTQSSMSTTSEAGDFENLGTPFADSLPQPVLAFRRDVKPWPMEYLSSAINRGLWNPDAIRLCEKHDIPLDRSMREVQPV